MFTIDMARTCNVPISEYYPAVSVCRTLIIFITGVSTPAASSNLKALEEAKLRASNVHRARNIGAEATDITQQAAAALLKGGAIKAPQVSVSCDFAAMFCTYGLLNWTSENFLLALI